MPVTEAKRRKQTVDASSELIRMSCDTQEHQTATYRTQSRQTRDLNLRWLYPFAVLSPSPSVTVEPWLSFDVQRRRGFASLIGRSDLHDGSARRERIHQRSEQQFTFGDSLGRGLLSATRWSSKQNPSDL